MAVNGAQIGLGSTQTTVDTQAFKDIRKFRVERVSRLQRKRSLSIGSGACFFEEVVGPIFFGVDCVVSAFFIC